jgi:hypothetical protein
MVKQYKINLRYNPQIDAGDNGNFFVRKEYNVINIAKPRQQVLGIIIQYVKKKSQTIDSQGKVYNTSSTISDLTDKNVKYSCDSYFEIFYVFKNGNSVAADGFGNDAMVKYEFDRRERKVVPNTYPVSDPLYQRFKTKGEITMVGENCFISESNPKYEAIKNLPWYYKPDTPANGLPYLPFSAATYDLIFSSSDSNILTHSVNVTWNFQNPKSIVTSNVIVDGHYTRAVGGRTKKIRHKFSRRRKTIRR